jgi:hypothetical protein
VRESWWSSSYSFETSCNATDRKSGATPMGRRRRPRRTSTCPQHNETTTMGKPTMNGEDSAPYRPGDVVWTTYGAGVIVGTTKGDQYTVRLWRHVGKSMATAALAFLNPSLVSIGTTMKVPDSKESIQFLTLFSLGCRSRSSERFPLPRV